MQHHVSALDTIAKHILGAVNPVVWASGGKDSLVLLHLMRPYATELRVLHVQMEDGFPDVTPNLVKQAEAWGYPAPLVLEPGIAMDDFIDAYGQPQDAFSCRLRRISVPLLVMTQRLESNRVFTGTKANETPGLPETEMVMKAEGLWGFVRINPLHHWSHQDVYDYVDTYAITLPETYRHLRPMHPQEGWSDCLSCPVKWAHWPFLKAYYPEEYERRWPDIQAYVKEGRYV